LEEPRGEGRLPFWIKAEKIRGNLWLIPLGLGRKEGFIKKTLIRLGGLD